MDSRIRYLFIFFFFTNVIFAVLIFKEPGNIVSLKLGSVIRNILELRFDSCTIIRGNRAKLNRV